MGQWETCSTTCTSVASSRAVRCSSPHPASSWMEIGAGRSRWGQPPRRDTAREAGKIVRSFSGTLGLHRHAVAVCEPGARRGRATGELLRIICRPSPSGGPGALELGRRW